MTASCLTRGPRSSFPKAVPALSVGLSTADVTVHTQCDPRRIML